MKEIPKAEVKNVSLDKESREIIVTIYAKGTMYVEEPKQYGFPMLLNCAPLVEGFNYVLEHGHNAVIKFKSPDGEYWKKKYEYMEKRCEAAEIAIPINKESEDEKEKLWDEAEDIFDKHTRPSEGGYGADYTDKWGFFNSLKKSFSISRKQK